MSDVQEKVQSQPATGGKGSALRQVIEKSRLTVTPVQSSNPFVSEALMFSGNARKLLGDFAALKGKFEELDDHLEGASEAVRKQSAAQAGDLSRRLELLSGTAVDATAEDRQKRQGGVDKLTADVGAMILKVDQRIVDEKATEKQRQAEETRQQQQIEADKKLIAAIGVDPDALKQTYGTKLDKDRAGRLGQLTTAFAAVTGGSRPLTAEERKSAQALPADSKAWAAFYDEHAALADKLAEPGRQVPDGASETERLDIEKRRKQADDTLAQRPVTPASKKAASDLIDGIGFAVETYVKDIAERQRKDAVRSKRGKEILALLATEPYAIPDGADDGQAQALGRQRQTIAGALAADPPAPEALELAEKTWPALGSAVTQAKLDIAERQQQEAERGKRRGEILGLLKTGAYATPEGVGDQQTQAFAKDRLTITDALADDPPAVGALKLAETTLQSLGTAVAKARQDIGEAAAAAQRPKDLRERWNRIDMPTFGPLLNKHPVFKPSRTFVDGLLREDPPTLSETKFKEAEDHIVKVEKCIADRIADFESEQQGFQQWLAKFAYLAGEIGKVRRTDGGAADAFNVRYIRQQGLVQSGLRLPIKDFTTAAAAKVDAALTELGTLAIEIQDVLKPPSGDTATFNWQDPTTWDVQAIRYDGTGTQGYVSTLSGSDPGLIDRIAHADVGDRHSAAKICTGKPMHQHTDSGSGGISFGYNHMGGVRVEPVIYDYAAKRNGNTYQWAHDAPSSGPAGLPGTVKAKA